MDKRIGETKRTRTSNGSGSVAKSAALALLIVQEKSFKLQGKRDLCKHDEVQDGISRLSLVHDNLNQTVVIEKRVSFREEVNKKRACSSRTPRDRIDEYDEDANGEWCYKLEVEYSKCFFRPHVVCRLAGSSKGQTRTRSRIRRVKGAEGKGIGDSRSSISNSVCYYFLASSLLWLLLAALCLPLSRADTTTTTTTALGGMFRRHHHHPSSSRGGKSEISIIKRKHHVNEFSAGSKFLDATTGNHSTILLSKPKTLSTFKLGEIIPLKGNIVVMATNLSQLRSRPRRDRDRERSYERRETQLPEGGLFSIGNLWGERQRPEVEGSHSSSDKSVSEDDSEDDDEDEDDDEEDDEDDDILSGRVVGWTKSKQFARQTTSDYDEGGGSTDMTRQQQLEHQEECEAKLLREEADRLSGELGGDKEEAASGADGSSGGSSAQLGSGKASEGGSGIDLNGGAGNSSSSSSTMNNTSDRTELIFNYTAYFVFITLFLLGTSTNTLTLYAVCRKKSLAPMDIYIIMLAINDLIYCLFALPVPPLYVLYYGEWVFGGLFCKLAAFLTSFSVHNSSITVVNIAQLRFRLVVHPFEPKITTLRAYMRTILACSLATLITIPYVLVVKMKYDDNCARLCDESWGDGEQGKWYRFSFSLFTTTVQFLLPLIGFEYYYKPIRDKLILLEKTHSNQAAGGGAGGGQQQSTIKRSYNQLELSDINKSSSVASSALALNQIQPSATNENVAQATTTTTATTSGNHYHSLSAVSVAAALKLGATGSGAGNSSRTTLTLAHPVSQSHHQHISTGSERERIRQVHLLSRLKKTRKVVYFFSSTWLPLNVFNLFSIWVESNTLYFYLHLIVQAIACCSVCLNPIMYPLSNDNYRQEFEHILPVCLLRKLDSLLKG